MSSAPITTRLPRYRRATEVPCDLTPRDLDILKAVQSFRLLTSEHIQLLAQGSDQGILRRLQKLFHAGYLDRLRPNHVPGGGCAKMIYAISNRGVQNLQKAGLIQRLTKTDWNAQNRSLHDLSIRHTLLISHIRSVLTASCTPPSGLELLFWREGRELQDTIEVALPDSYARIPVAPDGFFGLRDAQGRSHFFVEADRGTMTVKRFTRKLLAYTAYFREKRHTAKFGIRFFRVLTVTSSAARCQNLRAAAAAQGEVRALGRMLLFTSEEKLSLMRPKRVLEDIWSLPGSSEHVSLLGHGPDKTQRKEDVHPATTAKMPRPQPFTVADVL